MKHVFVETNWVFDLCAPAHRATPEAQGLVHRAARGEIVLHVPSAALREGGNAIRQKCQPKMTKELGDFRRWALVERRISAATASEVAAFFDSYIVSVEADMATLDARIDAIRTQTGIDVFALDDRMLDRAIALRASVATLKPFDEAILAAVLVKAGISRPPERWICGSATWTAISYRSTRKVTSARISPRCTSPPASRFARTSRFRDADGHTVSAEVSLPRSASVSSDLTAAITTSVLAVGHFANSAQPRNLSATSS